MTKKFLAFASVASLAVAGSVNAATVTVTQSGAAPSSAAIAAGAPASGNVNSYFLTSDADILAIDQVGITVGGGAIYQVPPPFGSDVEPPDPAFLALNRALEADTWITTPGATSLLGPALPGDGATTLFGDTTNDGAQTNFKFAQITTPDNAQGSFKFRIQLRGDTGPEFSFFNLPINGAIVPEPATIGLGAMSLFGLAFAGRRRS